MLFKTPLMTFLPVCKVKKQEIENSNLHNYLGISNMKRKNFKFGTSFDTVI